MKQTDQALLVMDVQPGIIERLPEPETFIKQVQSAADAARDHDIPVIFVVVSFRPGFPEVSPRSKNFQALKDSDRAEQLIDVKPAIELIDKDVLVTKRRVSAFTGSDLEVVLRARGITHLTLTGIATSGVVLSTLREAADKDYSLTILSDLCADSDDAVQEVLVGKVFPRQADVTTSADWIASL